MGAARPMLEGSCFVLRLATREDVPRIVAYQRANREHFRPMEPVRQPEYFTTEYWVERVEATLDLHEMDRGCNLFMFSTEDGSVMGHVNLSNFVRGAFQACHLGYGIGKVHEGKGLMSEAVRLAVGHAFDGLGLHRVMANYMPRNERSGRLLARLGFAVEGLAHEYLLINGKWEDHVLTSLVNPRWRPRA